MLAKLYKTKYSKLKNVCKKYSVNEDDCHYEKNIWNAFNQIQYT